MNIFSRRRIARISIAFATLAFVLPVMAQAKPSLKDWSFGSVVSGDSPSKADLKNKVVIVEYWGVHCPPCIASLPHLAELYDKNKDKGLVVIGAESQGSQDGEIKKVIGKAKVTYPVVKGADGPIQVSGIPHAFVFDSQGELVWDGNPLGGDMERVVSKALAALKASGKSSSVSPVSTNAVLIPTRSWTNADGKIITAAVKRADNGKVTFLMPNCSEIQYPLEKLSRESRDAIVEALGKNPAENVEIGE